MKLLKELRICVINVRCISCLFASSSVAFIVQWPASHSKIYIESSRLRENMCYWSGQRDARRIPFDWRRVQLHGRKVHHDRNRENLKLMKQNPTREKESLNQQQIPRSPKLHSSLTVRKWVIVLCCVLHNITLKVYSLNVSSDAGNTWHVFQNERIKL
jgi:hypothetical protein